MAASAAFFMYPQFSFKSEIWIYDGPAAWHFVNVTKAVSKQLKAMFGRGRGFGSIRVNVTIGDTCWDTSVFPDKSGIYLLPLKASVRKAEQLKAGQKISLTIQPK